ncbi:phosphotransferase [Candidatus Albibeggiatoa sp. nov. NOAA]|uniref:aminoglycoside phosphotransferase family protein n=1 Tax=Candidatus Albibeggiatoa sp. nov. NOAA TaxID=3162724 RepID=UPI0032F5A6F7|nr:phosphotransferase [Thiotrichaceae bacterium]
MSNRLNLLNNWLQTTLQLKNPTPQPLTNDASFRRYFRITKNGQSFVVMDAPPDKEDCHSFIDVANLLRQAGLNAPEIIAQDTEQGFLLLTDFGSQLYWPALQTDQADTLYTEAFQSLIKMQKIHAESLPLYDNDLLDRELDLFIAWLMEKHLGIVLDTDEKQQLLAEFELLKQSALSQPQVFVHRDYHSRNLMVTEANNPAILDFQDAVKGAITYDLVSLLRDCYQVWPTDRVEAWLNEYYQLAIEHQVLNQDVEFIQFKRWFDLMGIQRHLKASGIFARLYHRDGKDNYFQHIPDTLNYIAQVSTHYPELQFLNQLLVKRVIPAYLSH